MSAKPKPDLSNMPARTAAMTTRSLRLWHWRRAMAARLAADGYETQPVGTYAGKRQQQNNALADFHIKAVQVLNDCADCRETTAEQDDAIFPKPHSRVHHRNRPKPAFRGTVYRDQP